MSILMNNFERNLKNVLQREMSQKEAEEAIQEIRFGIYGNYYHKIQPVIYKDKNDNEKVKYPNINTIIKAYYSDDYSGLKRRD